MFRSKCFTVASLVFVLSPSAIAADKSAQSPLAASEKSFLMEAARGGAAEVQLAEMAATKASSDAVKELAQHLKDDHTKINQELAQLASSKGVAVPSEPGKMEQAIAKKLEKLSGSAFDKQYLQHLVQEHQQDVTLFSKQANNGKDEEVKQFASNRLPMLQEHLKRAQEVKGEVGTTDSAKGVRTQQGGPSRRGESGQQDDQSNRTASDHQHGGGGQ